MYGFFTLDEPLTYGMLALAVVTVIAAFFGAGVALGRRQVAVHVHPPRAHKPGVVTIHPDRQLTRELRTAETERDLMQVDRDRLACALDKALTVIERKDGLRATYLRLLGRERDKLAEVIHMVPELTATHYVTPPIERRLRLVEDTAA